MSRIASINRLSARRAGCTMGRAQTRPIARMPLSRASASRRSRAARSCSPLTPAGSARQPVSSKAMRSTRCGARRMISSATRPPIECPASAKEAGAVASTRSAIAPRLESGPVSWTRQSTNAPRRGSTGSHAARSQTSPGNRTSAPPRGGDAEEGRVCGCMADAIVCVFQARFTARAVRLPNRENTRRALPSKILTRSAALNHSIGSR